MLPSGQISHAIDGRMRVRIPERKGDKDFFARVREELEREPGIAHVQPNPLTGSVLITHDLDTERLAALVESLGLFHLEPESAEAPAPAADAASPALAALGSFVR